MKYEAKPISGTKNSPTNTVDYSSFERANRAPHFMTGACKGQKRVSEPLELELQMAVSC